MELTAEEIFTIVLKKLADEKDLADWCLKQSNESTRKRDKEMFKFEREATLNRIVGYELLVKEIMKRDAEKRDGVQE